MSARPVLALAAILAIGASSPALAWGSMGHRMIGEAAVAALPGDLPPFLHTKAAATAVGEFSREPDRSRGSGKAHDSNRDPGHFVDGRVDNAGARHTADPVHRLWLNGDRARREAQILVDIGLLSHFVGDGSMPLHVSVHYNGWGAFPNPANYTQDRVHVPWEGPYVRLVVTPAAMRAAMTPFRDCGCPIEQRVGDYLTADLATTIPFYELEKAGSFKPGVVKGVAFTTGRVAAGASELRDEIILAWRASADGRVGYQPEVAATDVESGKIDPYDSLYGDD